MCISKTKTMQSTHHVTRFQSHSTRLRSLIIEFLLRFSFRKQQFDFVTPRNIFQECALNLCLGLMHLGCVQLSMYCVIWFEKCVDVEFITNLILYHSSLFLNTNFDIKLLQSFCRKIALSRVQLMQPVLNDKHKLNIEQMASSNSYLLEYASNKVNIKK